MADKFYICDYCGDNFIPKRRRVQRFCSNSCRSKNHHYRQSLKLDPKNKVVLVESNTKVTDPKVAKNKTALKDISNSFLGTLAAVKAEKILTSDINRPATKKDILEIKDLLLPYQPILNLPQNSLGQWPYYDIETQTVIYLDPDNWPFPIYSCHSTIRYFAFPDLFSSR